MALVAAGQRVQLSVGAVHGEPAHEGRIRRAANSDITGKKGFRLGRPPESVEAGGRLHPGADTPAL